MKKNGLNVEHFRYHITKNYDKRSSAFMTNYKKQCNQIMCLCDQLRKLVTKVRPLGRMSLEPWIIFDQERMQLVNEHENV